MGIFFSTPKRPHQLPSSNQIVCQFVSLYESVLAESRRVCSGPWEQQVLSVGEQTLRRSEVSSDTSLDRLFSSNNINKSPWKAVEILPGGKGKLPNVFVICHKCSGQRAPMLGSVGLFTKFVNRILSLGCEVFFLLLDVESPAYLHRLLSEQDELVPLYRAGRLLPVFSDIGLKSLSLVREEDLCEFGIKNSGRTSAVTASTSTGSPAETLLDVKNVMSVSPGVHDPDRDSCSPTATRGIHNGSGGYCMRRLSAMMAGKLPSFRDLSEGGKPPFAQHLSSLEFLQKELLEY